MGSYMSGFLWKLICVDLNGSLYVRVSMEIYMWGFKWNIIRVDSMASYMCGFKWAIICEDFYLCYTTYTSPVSLLVFI